MIKLEIELPESCLNCPLNDGEYGWCNVDVSIPTNIYERPRSCPIIEEERQDDLDTLKQRIKELENKLDFIKI